MSILCGFFLPSKRFCDAVAALRHTVAEPVEATSMTVFLVGAAASTGFRFDCARHTVAAPVEATCMTVCSVGTAASTGFRFDCARHTVAEYAVALP
jgi:hypothetical protein